MRRIWLVCALLALAPQAAAADGSVRVLGGWGFHDSFRLGFGGTAGIHVPVGLRKIFAGARAMYHAGSSTARPIGLPGGFSVMGDVSQFQVGGELGIIGLEFPVRVRVTGDAGVSRITFRADTGEETTEHKFATGASVLVGKPVGIHSFLGLELRWMKVDGMDHTIGAYFTIGYALE